MCGVILVGFVLLDAVKGKKKWKAFLRSAGSREPVWEQAVDRFLKFFGPIWRAVADDAVFFGDWMPELNRFL